MVLSTEWSQVEIIDLSNESNSQCGFGFMLVGGKSTGVVIKALIPGGIAERDGRLQSGDHVLQIGDVNLRGFSSEQVATVLRSTGNQVRLIVARPVEPTSPDYQALASHAPIIPTKLLTDPEELDRTLFQTAGYTGTYISSPIDETDDNNICPTHIEVVALNNTINMDNHMISPSSMIMTSASAEGPLNNYISVERPETETYDVELRKNVYGLGITVAGYVCEEEDLSGIFVKSIIEGSAAEMSKMIQINDRIVAVDGRSLGGVTNHQAVDILRNTDIAVKLTLERFLRGRKYEHLQVALTDNNNTILKTSIPQSPSITTLSICAAKSDADSILTECGECGIEAELESESTFDSTMCFGLENGNPDDELITPETPTPTFIIDSVEDMWYRELPNSKIIVAEINKLSGLGISLEGTVEVEGGIELRPHHFIRSILNEGPVGKNGKLKPGDELLQVNEHKLQGIKHIDVVKILKNLPPDVKMVCARGNCPPSIINTSQDPEAFEARSILAGGLQSLQGGLLAKAQSESSLYTSSTATITDQHRSKSVEQISGLALWTTEVIYVEVEKTDRGFGFSILDYQDPLDTEGTVIVVRGLIPGGSAETTNFIFPGDRLVSVNEHSLNGATLDYAVNILKGIPNGIAKIGLCRPLSTSDNNLASPDDLTPTT